MLSALVPNRRGLDAALEAKVDKVAIFASVTESFSHKNTGGSIEGFDEEKLNQIIAQIPITEISGDIELMYDYLRDNI